LKKSIIFLIFGFLLGSIPLLTLTSAEDVSLIPNWIKNTAKFWVEGEVSDTEFINALQYMISQGILVIPPSENNQTTEEVTFESEVISCSVFGTDSMKVEYSVTNHFSDTVNVELVVKGLDSNEKVLSISTPIMNDIFPGQTKYDHTYIDDHPDLVSCGIEIQDVWE